MEKSEDRILIAELNHKSEIERLLKEKGLSIAEYEILIIGFKESKELELYVKWKNNEEFLLLKTYLFTNFSGKLGPKEAEGDKQIPEGFYYINRFNPKSNYHLSLGINYPNEFDKSLNHTGSDIFIHGGTETIGCIPLGDHEIEELYLFALYAKNNGQNKIPVYLFPFHLTDQNLEEKESYTSTPIFEFWKDLQKGYLQFQSDKRALKQ